MQKLYVLEGIDGTGKSTMTKFIKRYFEGRGIGCTTVESYPRDEDSMRLRNIWIQQQVPPIAVLAIILELRKRVLKTQIIPALLRGDVVISDRWNDTTWVYQGRGERIGMQLMRRMFDEILNMGDLMDEATFEDGSPLDADTSMALLTAVQQHRTIYLDTDVYTMRKRMQGRELDAFEKKTDHYFTELLNGFSAHFALRPAPLLNMVDARLSIEEVEQQIATIFDREVPYC